MSIFRIVMDISVDGGGAMPQWSHRCRPGVVVRPSSRQAHQKQRGMKRPGSSSHQGSDSRGDSLRSIGPRRRAHAVGEGASSVSAWRCGRRRCPSPSPSSSPSPASSRVGDHKNTRGQEPYALYLAFPRIISRFMERGR